MMSFEDYIYSKKRSAAEFNFDTLMIPDMSYYLHPYDIYQLNKIATDSKLNAKPDEKLKLINNIMKARGFRKFAGGTNRVVYACIDDPRFVAKIAMDKVGMKDNPAEYLNQFKLKPYVTKMFQVSPCGTVGFAERVVPIINLAEAKTYAKYIAKVIVFKILGKYVVDDIGSDYFMNWGIRPGFGPVILDYPYTFEVDMQRLYCNEADPITNVPCGGEIIYDNGFNHLSCSKCGKMVMARDLQTNKQKITIIKGDNSMRIKLINPDGTVRLDSGCDSNFITEPKPFVQEKHCEGLKVKVYTEERNPSQVEVDNAAEEIDYSKFLDENHNYIGRQPEPKSKRRKEKDQKPTKKVYKKIFISMEENKESSYRGFGIGSKFITEEKKHIPDAECVYNKFHECYIFTLIDDEECAEEEPTTIKVSDIIHIEDNCEKEETDIAEEEPANDDVETSSIDKANIDVVTKDIISHDIFDSSDQNDDLYSKIMSNTDKKEEPTPHDTDIKSKSFSDICKSFDRNALN